MSENDGGPAFPDPMRGAPGSVVNQNADLLPSGMTLRDWFAGQVVAQFVAVAMGRMDRWDIKEGRDGDKVIPDMWDVGDAANWAVDSYVIADAMLAEREKGKT